VHFGLGHIKPETLLKVDLAWRNSEGKTEKKTVWLKPGWHTVELGS
jgi:hypothetical protein